MDYLSAAAFSGTVTNANNILLTSDNTAGTYYIPFVKTSRTSQKPLFIDDTTTPLIYNPSTGRVTRQILDSSETYTNYIKTPSLEVDKITFHDGSVMRGYVYPTMSDADVANYNSGLSDKVKITTYDYHNVANGTVILSANFIGFTFIKLMKGETYKGCYFLTPTVGITCKVVLYTSGPNPTVLAQRTTNFTTINGPQLANFDATYTATTTQWAYIGIVSNSNMTLYIFNNNNTNFGNAAVANNFSLISHFVAQTYTNAFPNPYVGTPTAAGAKYFLGLY